MMLALTVDVSDKSVIEEFHNLYYDWVFTKQKDEYLTEAQKEMKMI